MSRVCYSCGRQAGIGHNVSRANNRTKRRYLPNLQRVRILEEGTVKRVHVCSRCIKADKVQKAP